MDLPVGRNLRDHLFVLAGPFVFPKPVSNIKPINQATVDTYLHHGTGPLATTIDIVAAQFPSSRAIRSGQKLWPDTQLIIQGFKGDDEVYNQFTKGAINETHFREFYASTVGKEAFHVITLLVRPNAVGEILLKSADYKDDPLINPKYLEDKENTDIDVLVEG